MVKYFADFSLSAMNATSQMIFLRYYYFMVHCIIAKVTITMDLTCFLKIRFYLNSA